MLIAAGTAGAADLALIYADTDKCGNGLCRNHQERIRKFHADLFGDIKESEPVLLVVEL